MNINKSKIYVIGTGQNPKKHMTLEAVEVCRNCDKLLLINGDSVAVLNAIGGHNNSEDIADLYVDGDIDDNNYIRIVKKIVSESTRYNKICVTTAGHPLVGVSWWERLKRAEGFNSDLIYVEGISSLTTMMTELESDPLENGTILLDANRLLLFNQIINPEFDLYIFNFCSTGTRKTNISCPYKDNELIVLRDHLLKFYPENHKLFMVSASHFDSNDSYKIEVNLINLTDLLSKITFYSSLFIPGINPSSYNKSFLKKL